MFVIQVCVLWTKEIRYKDFGAPLHERYPDFFAAMRHHCKINSSLSRTVVVLSTSLGLKTTHPRFALAPHSSRVNNGCLGTGEDV